MARSQRRTELVARIREMAASGQHAGARSIEAHLRTRYPEVLTEMKEDFLGGEIDFACQGRSVFDA